MKALLSVAVLVGVLALIWTWRDQGAADVPTKPTEQREVQKVFRPDEYQAGTLSDEALLPFGDPKKVDRANVDSRFTRLTGEAVIWHDSVASSLQLAESSLEAEERLAVVAGLFDAYRLVFQENPVGTENFEFTEALRGRNRLKTHFVHPSVVTAGQLVDSYGRPYWFHSVSATELEIISAGEDGVLFTEDDLSSLGESSLEESE